MRRNFARHWPSTGNWSCFTGSRDILDRQERENWGAKVIDRLAADLKRAFPDMKGFSPRNLKYMMAFGEAWPDEAIVQQLVAQIPWESGRLHRQGKAVANFDRTLPAPQSDLAQDITKDPYNFDFLPLRWADQEFYIDLLFYHLKLRVYVVIDLKMKSFEPEFAGKMNFYLSAVNDLLRHPDDQPSIGLILCKTKDRFVAEYSLRDFNKPIGISE